VARDRVRCGSAITLSDGARSGAVGRPQQCGQWRSSVLPSGAWAVVRRPVTEVAARSHEITFGWTGLRHDLAYPVRAYPCADRGAEAFMAFQGTIGNRAIAMVTALKHGLGRKLRARAHRCHLCPAAYVARPARMLPACATA
jgi:hypothetical protein